MGKGFICSIFLLICTIYSNASNLTSSDSIKQNKRLLNYFNYYMMILDSAVKHTNRIDILFDSITSTKRADTVSVLEQNITYLNYAESFFINLTGISSSTTLCWQHFQYNSYEFYLNDRAKWKGWLIKNKNSRISKYAKLIHRKFQRKLKLLGNESILFTNWNKTKK